MRRWYVDEYCFKHIGCYPPRTLVLDVGGHKIRPRGQFNIMNYGFNRICFNIVDTKGVDVLGDALKLPFNDGTFELVVLSEVLEHVRSPVEVLRENFRVLKPGSNVVVTVPFMYRIHADPYDYGRYTDTYWKEVAKEIGFEIIDIKPQGSFYSVVFDIFAGAYAVYVHDHGVKIYNKWLDWILAQIAWWVLKKDQENDLSFKQFYKSLITGYGIVLRKPTL